MITHASLDWINAYQSSAICVSIPKYPIFLTSLLNDHHVNPLLSNDFLKVKFVSATTNQLILLYLSDNWTGTGNSNINEYMLFYKLLKAPNSNKLICFILYTMAEHLTWLWLASWHTYYICLMSVHKYNLQIVALWQSSFISFFCCNSSHFSCWLCVLH